MSSTDQQDDYCHIHGGWGSDKKPCRVCGALSPPNTFPEIPKGLSFDKALSWAADEITKRIKMDQLNDKQQIVRCSNCNCEITADVESPERGICGTCLIYIQDIQNEEASREQRQIITREMAIDAGFPEMEGLEW